MHKLIAVITVVIFFASVVPTEAQIATETVVNINYLQVVKELGIMDAFSKHEPDNSPISRGEFASVIIKLVGMKGSDGGQIFSDVSQDYPYFPQIALANELGIMTGDGNGNFFPEQPLIYAQAVKCLLHILGYTAYAESSGGYPLGYLMQANRFGILKGIKYQENQQVSRAELAQIIYNCLDISLMTIVSVGKDAVYSSEHNETVLSRYFGIRKFKGIFTYLDGRSIQSRTWKTDDGCIKIGNTLLTYSDVSKIADYLGYYMEVYATNQGKPVEHLIYAFPTKDNQELTVKISDLLTDKESFSLTRFYYNALDGYTAEARLTEERPFLYNGVYDYDFDLADLDFDTGYVKLVDYNSDDIYDVCFVWDYENFVLESVSDSLANCHYNKSLRYNDKKTYHVLAGDGVLGDWEQLLNLSNWDVLSVAESKDGSLVTIRPNSRGISGTVTSVENDGKSTKVIIDGQQYIVSSRYMEANIDSNYVIIKPGLASEFYFDVIGEIAAVYHISNAEYNYGYLLAVEKVGRLSDDYWVKIFSQNGKIEIYKTNEKVFFSSADLDDVLMKAGAVMDNFYEPDGFTPQMILYRADEKGVLTHIQQFTDATALGYNLEKFSRDFNMGVATGNSNKFRFLNVAMTFGTGARYDKQFHITDSTIIFYAPRKNGVLCDDNLSILQAGFFEQDYYDNIQVFDCDDTYTASAIIYTPETEGALGRTLNEPYFIVVLEVLKGLDSKGEVKSIIRGLYSGKEQEFIYDSADESIPEKGSIILYEKGLDGDLIVREKNVVYSPSKTVTLYDKKEHFPTSATESQLPIIWSQIGRLWRKNGSAITIYVGTDHPWPSYLSNRRIYKVTKNNKAELADESILIPSTGISLNASDGSLLVINGRYHYAREVFVIEE